MRYCLIVLAVYLAGCNVNNGSPAPSAQSPVATNSAAPSATPAPPMVSAPPQPQWTRVATEDGYFVAELPGEFTQSTQALRIGSNAVSDINNTAKYGGAIWVVGWMIFPPDETARPGTRDAGFAWTRETAMRPSRDRRTKSSVWNNHSVVEQRMFCGEEAGTEITIHKLVATIGGRDHVMWMKVERPVELEKQPGQIDLEKLFDDFLSRATIGGQKFDVPHP
jgi:hypothetical protein